MEIVGIRGRIVFQHGLIRTLTREINALVIFVKLFVEHRWYTVLVVDKIYVLILKHQGCRHEFSPD